MGTTVGEQGYNLPVGFMGEDGSLVKAFKLRPFTGKVDRILGGSSLKKKSHKKRTNEGLSKISDVVAILLSEANGKSFELAPDGRPKPSTLAFLDTWHMGDVLYAYLMARIEAVGSTYIFRYEHTDGECGNSSNYELNLEDIEVQEITSSEALYKWHELKSPVELQVPGRSKELAKSLRIGPINWGQFMRIREQLSSNMGLVGGMTSVCAYSEEAAPAKDSLGVQCMLKPKDLDEFTKRDLNALDASAVDSVQVFSGLLEFSCDGCGDPVVNPIVWEYDFFYTTSTREQIL